jgi:tRNA-dihydrouridine synthase
MDGITDEAFRLLQVSIARPNLLFTEFVSAEGLCRGGIKLFTHLLYSAIERPIIGQLFGKDPDSFYKSSVILAYLGFDGVDLNLGCPAKTVFQHGSGAALIANPTLAKTIIMATHSALSDYAQGKVKISELHLNQKTLDVLASQNRYSGYIPNPYRPTLSVKTRLGISQDISPDWISYLSRLPLNFITLHGRTLKEGYSGLANWESIKAAAYLAHDAKIKFFGNGDIGTLAQAKDYCQRYQVDGCLIGRAALGNPWIFSDHLPTLTDRFNAMLLHTQLYQQVFPDRPLDSLRHHYLSYVSGHPRAKQLRAKLVTVSTLQQLLDLEPSILT